MKRLLFVFFALLVSINCWAEEEPPYPEEELLAGHSQHGEAFNEGPRSAARHMNGVGPIHFEVTSKNPEAQKFIEQGIGQVHGYWYLEAERSFRQAAMLDPDCAIAYWGMAKANANNSKRSKEFIQKAFDLKENASDREQMYINATHAYLTGKKSSKEKTIQYAADVQAIVEKYPDDLEAKALYAYLAYRRRTYLKLSMEEANDAIGAVLAVEKMHPVHHYRIHLWDAKDSERALESAARCGQAAPNIAHMWHMPGHIYSRLKRYEDAVWQQEASARTDHANMMRDQVMPDEIHNFAHNNEWLIRNLIYIGRWKDAVSLATNMTELPRHPKNNKLSGRGSANYGRQRLFAVLSQYELWEDLIELSDSPALEPTDIDSEKLKRLRYRGIAFANLDQVDQAKATIQEIQAVAKPLLDEVAELKKKEKNPKKPSSNLKKKNGEVEKYFQAMAAIDGYLAAKRGEYEQAVKLLEKGKESNTYVSRYRLLAGDKDRALREAKSAVSSGANQVLPAAREVELLWLADKKEEAKKAFEALREISGSIQYGSPVFDRLKPISRELKLPADWRKIAKPATDLGKRPKLDELGPFRWSPSPAADWSLAGADGKQVSLKDYENRPVIVIFYLGFGCLHCVEQIKAIVPKTEEFRAAGIEIVAIGSEDQESLKTALKNYGSEIPFPLLGDGALQVFRKYRAYDDFEDTPLHGTFLIDGKGDVRWRDIGYEPFMDIDFLLEESQRLLNQKPPVEYTVSEESPPEVD